MENELINIEKVIDDLKYIIDTYAYHLSTIRENYFSILGIEFVKKYYDFNNSNKNFYEKYDMNFGITLDINNPKDSVGYKIIKTVVSAVVDNNNLVELIQINRDTFFNNILFIFYYINNYINNHFNYNMIKKIKDFKKSLLSIKICKYYYNKHYYCFNINDNRNIIFNSSLKQRNSYYGNSFDEEKQLIVTDQFKPKQNSELYKDTINNTNKFTFLIDVYNILKSRISLSKIDITCDKCDIYIKAFINKNNKYNNNIEFKNSNLFYFLKKDNDDNNILTELLGDLLMFIIVEYNKVGKNLYILDFDKKTFYNIIIVHFQDYLKTFKKIELQLINNPLNDYNTKKAISMNDYIRSEEKEDVTPDFLSNLFNSSEISIDIINISDELNEFCNYNNLDILKLKDYYIYEYININEKKINDEIICFITLDYNNFFTLKKEELWTISPIKDNNNNMSNFFYIYYLKSDIFNHINDTNLSNSIDIINKIKNSEHCKLYIIDNDKNNFICNYNIFYLNNLDNLQFNTIHIYINYKYIPNYYTKYNNFKSLFNSITNENNDNNEKNIINDDTVTVNKENFNKVYTKFYELYEKNQNIYNFFNKETYNQKFVAINNIFNNIINKYIGEIILLEINN